MPRLQITPHLSNLINSRRILGQSTRKVSKDLNIPKSTAAALFKKQRENQPICIARRGRPRLTTPRGDAAIRLASKINRFRTQKELSDQFHLSATTIRDRLRRQNIRSRVAIEEDVTPAHKVARVQWCRQHKNENFQFWIFSDESSFELHNVSVPRRLWVHRSNREKFARCCVTPLITKNRQSVMVWGAISASGPVAFGFVDGRITAPRYIQCLNDLLLPILDDFPLDRLRNTVFQQDNARPHSAIMTQQFLAANAFRTTLWPANSPDLNPIEKVWAAMKRNVRSRKPATIRQLRQAIVASWRDVVTEDFCNRLYASLHDTMTTVINRRGSR